MDKILIVAAKLYNDPTGGGGTVVKHLIDTFINDYVIDLVLYRTPLNSNFSHGNLNTFFHPIKYRSDNKFERRIKNVDYNLNYLVNNFNLKSYIKILIVHTSKMFGFENLEEDILEKTILFPMFLTPSYTRSNEYVPDEYTVLEKKALNCVSHIVTPSQSEKEDIVDYYHIDERKIAVIERGIDDVFFGTPNIKINNPVKLICVSSIKPQKNVIESIYILENLLKNNINAQLTIIGRAESNKLINEIRKYCIEHQVDKYVKLIEGAPQFEVAEAMKNADIFILTSLWETFGRVVYEGFASGLPAVIRADIECFSEIAKKPFVLTYHSIDEASSQIINLVNNNDFYKNISFEAVLFAKNYHSHFEKNRLKEVIIWRG